VKSFLAIATVLVAGIVLSGEVSAGCGDYLFRNGVPVSRHDMKPSSSMQSAQRPATQQDHATDSDASRSKRRQNAPCSGPGCSGSPASPFAPSIPDQRLVNESACLNDWRSMPCAEIERFEHQLFQFIQDVCLDSLFRPPKSAIC